MSKKRILSGVQPSGQLHLGNYLGAIHNWVDLQQQYESFFCIVDYHAVTIPYDPRELQQKTLETAADYLACGIDPRKSVIFLQSHVPEHTELAWIFNTITPLGELERMTQFKDKAVQHQKNIHAGLLTYPLLMAADILLYKPDLIPVGQDQKQHVELTRTIAAKFNRLFAEVFPLPTTYITRGARIMGLDQPEKKMSKSLGPKNYIALADTPDVIRQKISRAVTDSGTEIAFAADRPAINNLLRIYQLLSGLSDKKTEEKFRGVSYREFKGALAELVIEYLQPIREKREKYLRQPDKLRKILAQGATEARKVAQKTLKEAKKAMGFLPTKAK